MEKLQRHVITKQRVEDVVISVDVSRRDLSDDVTRLAIGTDADVEGGSGERGFVGVARHLDGDECRGGWSRGEYGTSSHTQCVRTQLETVQSKITNYLQENETETETDQDEFM